MFFNETAISIKNIGKRYEIYKSPGDRLKQFIFPKISKLLGKNVQQYFQDFWALRDISIIVQKGETLGIIGRNGSGKSTLLQLICGTLNPTEGQIQVAGRVAALLELGSGFNPEFTGKENIYLYASILGLSKNQIDSRFNKICEFADIGDFIEQPVKIYSSGMQVRLAFAVIAHVDADILIIDEALAVGDAIFVQKCMRFIRAFKDRGTLIFVSHDTGSVLNLCDKVLWIESGRFQGIGNPKQIIEDYLQFSFQKIAGDKAPQKNLSGSSTQIRSNQDVESVRSGISIVTRLDQARGWETGAGKIIDVNLKRLDCDFKSDLFEGGERVCLSIKAKINTHLERPILGFLVRDRLGQDLFGENTLNSTGANLLSALPGESIEGKFIFDLPMLPNGQYVMMVSLADGTIENHVQHHWLHDALVINVSSSNVRWGLVGIKFENVILKKLA